MLPIWHRGAKELLAVWGQRNKRGHSSHIAVSEMFLISQTGTDNIEDPNGKAHFVENSNTVQSTTVQGLLWKWWLFVGSIYSEIFNISRSQLDSDLRVNMNDALIEYLLTFFNLCWKKKNNEQWTWPFLPSWGIRSLGGDSNDESAFDPCTASG